MKEPVERKKHSRLFQRLCDEKFRGDEPDFSWGDFKGMWVLVAEDSENEYFFNNTGTTIFYRNKRNSREVFCFDCDSEIIKTERLLSYNCREIPEGGETTIRYPHCPKCKPVEKLPKRFYDFFDQSPSI